MVSSGCIDKPTEISCTCTCIIVSDHPYICAYESSKEHTEERLICIEKHAHSAYSHIIVSLDFLSQTDSAVVNDLEADGTPKKNLSGYTSLLRLLLLSLITLSLWYSVGVGVSTCRRPYISVYNYTYTVIHVRSAICASVHVHVHVRFIVVLLPRAHG
jgi:hypothetical protein